MQRTYGATCDFGGKPKTCEVRLTVSKVVATVADRIEIVLSARAPEGVRVEWPAIAPIEGLSALGVDDQAPIMIAAGDAGERQQLVRRIVLLEPFLPGEPELQGMEVRIVGPTGSTCKIATEPVKIQVKSLLEGEPKDPELRGVVDPKPEGLAWWVWAAGAGSILAVAGVAAVALRRRGPGEQEVLTPYAAAMRRLAELEGTLAEGSTAKQSAVLGDILRTFVAGVMGMTPADRTTEQLLTELGDQPSVNVASLREVLSRLDEASFAGTVISVGEAQELRDKVYKMIVGMQAAHTAAEAAAAKESA